VRRAALGLAAALTATSPLAAQAPVTGYVSMLLDVVGRPATDVGGRDADIEWRPRAFLEYRRDAGDHVRLRLSGYVEGLVADRHQVESPTTDLIARPQELYVEFVSERADLRLGYSRIVWGRLDELQPTDVVNPLDLAKFFFEGRAEARIPVAMARARLFLAASTTLEAVVVPQFRPGRFDQLDEPTSAFNLLAGILPPGTKRGPGPRTSWTNLQGGARLQTTTGRVDWSVSGYRGFETFGVLQLTPDAAALEEAFPRFTMVGGDFETVHGEWGIRGEVAAFVDDSFQTTEVPVALDGRSIEGGIGADRKAARLRYLKARWVKRLQPQPKFQIHTSLDPLLSCAIATVGIEGVPPAQITSKLWEKWRIIATPISHAEYQGIRVTPNVYTTLDEVDAFGDAMEAIAKGA